MVIPGAVRRRPRELGDMAALFVAALLALYVIWAFRFRGWWGVDEGTIGQAALRVLHGQVPHRDFEDPYSGGLGLLHALVFRLRGVSMNSLRSHLALTATIWFAGMFWLLTRWLRPRGAALAAILLAVWSVPLYPAAMPSWYVLFLGCAAGAVLVVWPGRPQVAVLLAGFAIGIAATIKVTAFFALAGALWALVALRQAESRDRRGSIEVLVAAPVFMVLVLLLLGRDINGSVLAHLALPPLAVVAAIAWREGQQVRASGAGFDAALWRRAGTLVGGTAVPIAAYAAWLARHDALMPFLSSLRIVVGQRVASASQLPPAATAVAVALPVAAILFGVGRWFRVRPAVLVAGGIVVAVVAWSRGSAYREAWSVTRGLLPASALFFAAAWPRLSRSDLTIPLRGAAVFCPLAAMLVLTQFPYAAPVYFLYVAPVFVLAASAVVAMRPPSARTQAAALAGLFMVFGTAQVFAAAPEGLGIQWLDEHDWRWVETRAGRLLVPPGDAIRYERVLGALDSLPPGPIWAGPDAPEIAFLSNRVDLNRSSWDFLGPDNPPSPGLAERLATVGTQAVVVDTKPFSSRKLTRALLDSIEWYFPRTVVIDQYQVHFRSSVP
ncbi:MAG TPA: hypothetical protein VGL65_02635 [Gemmatimonadales bacterium]